LLESKRTTNTGIVLTFILFFKIIKVKNTQKCSPIQGVTPLHPLLLILAYLCLSGQPATGWPATQQQRQQQ